MTLIFQNVKDLTPDDFFVFPVWEFVLELEDVNDMMVRPVATLPVNDLGNRIIGTRVQLANGTTLWAQVGNVDLQDWAETRQFMALSLFWDDRWVHQFPRHDFGQRGKSATALASTLGIRVSEIFPIAYDVSSCCVGNPDVVRNFIDSGPTI